MKKILLTLFLLVGLTTTNIVYSQTFQVVGITIKDIKTNQNIIDELYIPSTVIITNDSLFQFIKGNTTHIFFMTEYWNLEESTRYVVTDNKSHFYDINVIEFNKEYYLLIFESEEKIINYDLKKIN